LATEVIARILCPEQLTAFTAAKHEGSSAGAFPQNSLETQKYIDLCPAVH